MEPSGDFVVECGLMEYQYYYDPAGTTVLDEAVELNPEDEKGALA
jgi:hypothetical protein